MRKKPTSSSKPISEEKLAELKSNAYLILCEVRRNLLQRFPFVGAIAMSLDLVPVRDIRLPTAATDGQAVYFDIAFLSELSFDERMFVLAHEIYHSVLMHMLRQENRDKHVFNVASDIEVNSLLEKDGMQLLKECCCIRSGLHPNGFDFPEGQNAETYYELLLKHMKKNCDQKSGNDGDGGCGDGDGDDERDGNKSGKLSGQFDRHISKNEDVSGEKTFEVSDKYGKVGLDPDFRPMVTKSGVERVRESAVAAAQMVERQYGTLPGHIKNIVNSLSEPKVDWRETLCQFVTRSCGDGNNTWNRPNRRFVYSGTYLPSHETTNMNVVVVLDTSGSVAECLPQFLGELNSLVKSFGNYRLTVIQNDTEVEKVDEYSDENPLDLEHVKFEVSGYGGTDLRPAFKYVRDKGIEADCIVAMTDGEFERIGEACCDIPTMWMLTENGTSESITFGEIIKYGKK